MAAARRQPQRPQIVAAETVLLRRKRWYACSQELHSSIVLLYHSTARR